MGRTPRVHRYPPRVTKSLFAMAGPERQEYVIFVTLFPARSFLWKQFDFLSPILLFDVGACAAWSRSPRDYLPTRIASLRQFNEK